MEQDKTVRHSLGADVALGGKFTPPQRVMQLFDWDDNVMEMPTKLVLTHKHSGQKAEVETRFFGQIFREEVGKPGSYWEHFEAREDAFNASKDDPTGRVNRFLSDIQSAMNSGNERWRGPRWDEFVHALSTPESAEHVGVVSARWHEPNSMHSALSVLQQDGVLLHVPPQENLYPVCHPSTIPLREGVQGDFVPIVKANVLKQTLDQLQAHPIANDALPVLSPDGSEHKKMHVWKFSDDDHGNFSRASKILSEEIANGRWPDVKVVLDFTGKVHPTELPHTLVLTGDKPRAFLPEEQQEMHRVMENNRALGENARSVPNQTTPELTPQQALRQTMEKQGGFSPETISLAVAQLDKRLQKEIPVVDKTMEKVAIERS